MIVSRLRNDSGFAMIEAIVASVLLVVVALGVLKGLDTAQRSSGREKARSTAAALTEQDQEQLRSFRAVDLANYDYTRDITVNKVKYTVSSQVDWVRDSTGGTESCNNNTSQADYMRITSTTQSQLINTPIPPVKMSSIVAPPVGAFAANQGTLGVQVNGRDGVGVPGVPVTITGPATVSNPTNSAGCAIFAYVPIGSYTARVNSAGWVDRGGNQNASVGATVTAGKVVVASMVYDRAASVDVTFDTRKYTNAVVPASSTQLSASNNGVPAGPFSPFARLRTYDAGTLSPSIAATGLFPFADGYGLFAGGCPGADPSNFETDQGYDYYTNYPDQFIQTTPGAASAPVVVRLPSINLRVLHGLLPMATTFNNSIRILVKSKSPDCSEVFNFPMPAADAQGWMDPAALPFGDYQVCVDALTPGSPSSRRKKTITTLKNRWPEGIKLPEVLTGMPVIDMSIGTSGGSCT